MNRCGRQFMISIQVYGSFCRKPVESEQQRVFLLFMARAAAVHVGRRSGKWSFSMAWLSSTTSAHTWGRLSCALLEAQLRGQRSRHPSLAWPNYSTGFLGIALEGPSASKQSHRFSGMLQTVLRIFSKTWWPPLPQHTGGPDYGWLPSPAICAA